MNQTKASGTCAFESKIQEAPWAKHLPSLELPKNHTSLAQCIADHARERPDHSAAEFLGKTITYSELDLLSNQLVNAWDTKGIQPGDTIGIHLPNTPQYLICLVAASKLNCPVTGISPLLTPPELAYQMADANVHHLVSLDSLYVENVLPAERQLTELRSIIVTGALDLLPFWKRHLAYLLRKLPKISIRPAENISTQLWLDIVPKQPADAYAEKTTAEDIVYIQYTGGTTGKPKGAELSLKNLDTNASQALSFLRFKAEDTIASAFPLFHLAGLAIALMALRSGARQLLFPDPRNIDQQVKTMEQFPPTMIGNVPSLYQLLLENAEFRKLDFKELRIAFSGAAPFAPEAIRDLEVVIGQGKLCEVYGMTEASPLITINPPGKAKQGTVGIPVPGCIVKIVDVDNPEKEMPFGMPGEITIAGPQVMTGYRKRPEATAETLRKRHGHTWLHTGDIGFMDEDGYITISDRAKDMLIVGGFKVFSVEIESKLAELDFIEHSAIIGSPDKNRPGNDIVHLFIQPTSSDLSREENEMREKIQSFCKYNMAPYKVPKSIHFLKELPLTAVGKLDKKVLRKELLDAEVSIPR